MNFISSNKNIIPFASFETCFYVWNIGNDNINRESFVQPQTNNSKRTRTLVDLGKCICVAMDYDDPMFGQYLPLSIDEAQSIVDYQLESYEYDKHFPFVRSIEIFQVLHLLSPIFKIIKYLNSPRVKSRKSGNKERRTYQLMGLSNKLFKVLDPVRGENKRSTFFFFRSFLSYF